MVAKKRRRRIVKDRPEDIKMQKEIIARSNWSLAILGMAFIRHGSGRFLNLRANSKARI